MMTWETYWNTLIKEKKLQTQIADMDSVDIELQGKAQIKEICHSIYDDYRNYKGHLDRVKVELLRRIDTLSGVHLQTSRVKDLDSLLVKIISKRHQHLLDKDNLYSGLNVDNYKDVLTDLIGMRLIINYRGKWEDLHNEIIDRFPYVEDTSRYKSNFFIPHLENGEGIIAEMPVAYYAYGDNVDMYKNAGIRTQMRDDGYRSIHYVISFQHTYVEIQVRTIYDEAWSDCDHLYVYKHEENKSHAALKELSQVLCSLTNSSNDLGEVMRVIYQHELIEEKDGIYSTDATVLLQIENVFAKIKATQDQMEELIKHYKG